MHAPFSIHIPGAYSLHIIYDVYKTYNTLNRVHSVILMLNCNRPNKLKLKCFPQNIYSQVSLYRMK